MRESSVHVFAYFIGIAIYMHKSTSVGIAYFHYYKLPVICHMQRKRRELIDRGLTILSPEETLEQAVAYHAYKEASAWMNERVQVSDLESNLVSNNTVFTAKSFLWKLFRVGKIVCRVHFEKIWVQEMFKI